MRALHWNGQRLHLDLAYPLPPRQEDMALVRVHLAGICATDLHIFQGYMGFQGVPGHEFVGEVCAGPASWLGQRVVGEINFACGQCSQCRQGLGRHCPGRRVMGILHADGSFADYVSVPVQNLHRVPETVTDEAAVFTEPLAAAYEILEQVAVTSATTVVVLGDGKLGLLCAQVLHNTGARVSVLGKHPQKLAFLQQRGIHTVMLPALPAPQADVVVEASGSPTGLELALTLLRPRGTLVLKSTVSAAHTLSLAPLVINEVTVVGSRCGPFPPALQALAQQQVSVTPLIECTYSLTEALSAVAHATRPGARKIMLRL
ncbi:MAG: alcohol dehydrogenase catalytic domain-containing protein [Candidatus Tectimicrobiota bacterium]